MAGPIDITVDFQALGSSDPLFSHYLSRLLETTDHSFANTLQWQRYILATYSPKVDASLVYVARDNVLAFFSGYLYRNNVNCLEYHVFAQDPHGWGLPEPIYNSRLSQKQRNYLASHFIDSLKKIAHDHMATNAFALYDISSLDCTSLDICSSIWMDKSSSQPIFCLEDLIDTQPTIEALWENLRHSHKSTINKGLKVYRFEEFDSTSISDDHLRLHMNLHRIGAGKQTRPTESFEAMHEFVRQGKGLFHIQYLEDRPVQTLYTLLGSNCAYGGSLATDTTVQLSVPPTHSLNWNMLLMLKQRQIRYYHTRVTSLWPPSDHIGTQTSDNQLSKLRNLAIFKSGLGGKKMPFLRFRISLI